MIYAKQLLSPSYKPLLEAYFTEKVASKNWHGRDANTEAFIQLVAHYKDAWALEMLEKCIQIEKRYKGTRVYQKYILEAIEEAPSDSWTTLYPQLKY